jgi:hypothetical protein
MRWDSPPDRVGPLRLRDRYVQAHVDQKTQTAGNFLEQFRRNYFAVAGKFQSGEKFLGFTDGHFGDVDDGAVVDLDGENFGLQPTPPQVSHGRVERKRP